jgi:hypothetical protein
MSAAESVVQAVVVSAARSAGLISDDGMQSGDDVALDAAALVEAVFAFEPDDPDLDSTADFTFGRVAAVVWTSAAATTAGVDDFAGICSAPNIQVHTPFSQPQNPPLDAVDVSLGLAVAVAVAVELPEAEAEGEVLDGDATWFSIWGAAEVLVLFFGVALAERLALLVADADAEALDEVDAPQTVVGYGRGAGLAACAGAANVRAPTTPAVTVGIATATTARRPSASLLRPGTAGLPFGRFGCPAADQLGFGSREGLRPEGSNTLGAAA